ncbi:hypothetical protein E1J38_011785 [Seonamhaeicola sediminis]|uniref:Uncharacterized protein n=1 Tax=Seonamhaeicola sediminis TaxID=2528206 RepID=A0A562YCF4_9FLAO|nr:hypothetical protein [Seonamhaeicola sediminis]TWO31751.1 hypothetical protein E1J38_011785 [Seonamhaeicola sediminis]
MSKTIYRAFGIRYKQNYAKTKEVELPGGGSNIYLEELSFKFYHPEDLKFKGVIGKLEVKNDMIILRLGFQGGESDKREKALKSKRSWNQLNLKNVLNEKIVLDKNIEIQFIWQGYNNKDEVTGYMPETTGKSILISP